MFEEGFTPSTACDEVTGHHIHADICKCEHDKEKQKTKQINEIADSLLLEKWHKASSFRIVQLKNKVLKIKELTE